MKTPKCHAQKCNKPATQILRKRCGISCYCDECFKKIMERRKKNEK